MAALYSGKGDKPVALAASELLTGVTLPTPPPKAGAAWEKIRMRKGLDFAVASAAVYVEVGPGGTCSEARVVLGALGTTPIRVP
jgi:CO/xanthine dehydrogenase FAD-binding subunit